MYPPSFFYGILCDKNEFYYCFVLCLKLNTIYSKLNAINKKMRLIRKEKEAKKQRLDPYFKLFDFPNEEYIQTIIELNNLLKKHQPVIGKQIIKCLNYLNDRGIDIVL